MNWYIGLRRDGTGLDVFPSMERPTPESTRDTYRIVYRWSYRRKLFALLRAAWLNWWVKWS